MASGSRSGEKLGFSKEAITDINRRAVALAAEIRDASATSTTQIVINGVVGPRGDGYRADARVC